MGRVYSSGGDDLSKVKSRLDTIENKINVQNVTLLASGWSNAYPFTNTVSVSGITPDMTAVVTGVYIPENETLDNVKAIIKASSFLMMNSSDSAVTAGKITFLAYKKLAVNFTVVLKTIKGE